MAQTLHCRPNLEDRLIFWSLALSYPIFMVGGFYVLGSVLGWLLLLVFLFRGYLLDLGDISKAFKQVSPVIWFWCVSMLVMLVALLVAHLERQLGMGQTIKSTFGWAKGWALMALFPLLGAMLKVKPELVSRACCIAAGSAMPFFFVGVLLYLIGHSGFVFTSPFKFLGGPGEVFAVTLFGINPETGLPRWQFQAPWAPAAGLLSCFYLVMVLQEKSVFYRSMGIAGVITMCLFCQSRAGWIIFFAIIPIMVCLGEIKNPVSWLILGVVIPAIVLLGQPLIDLVMQSYQDIKDARPGSTRVRELLATIALQRWWDEAPIWGHGVVESGPKIVEFMPIGSHHSWYGLLFVKGIVGLLALALPLLLTLLSLLVLAQFRSVARTALALVVIMIAYSFFENLEILAYMYWPALFWIGMAFRPKENSEQSAKGQGTPV